MKRLIQKTPRGGIQMVFRMEAIFIPPSHTYCTEAEQTPVRRRLKRGRSIYPTREKDHDARPNESSVRITA
jgi:hypothetical protein